MKGFVKCIIAGAVILGIGIAILIIALAVNGWKFSPNFEFETKEYTSTASDITKLSVEFNAGKLQIEYRDDDSEEIYISYPVAEGYQTAITEKDHTLSIVNEVDIYGNMFSGCNVSCGNWAINIPATTVVKIPKNTICDLSINLNAGTVEIPDSDFTKVSLKVNAGSCHVGRVGASELFEIDLRAGSVTVEGVNTAKLDCEVHAGSANVNAITSKETNVEVHAGAANIAFNGIKSQYVATVKVTAGSCNGLSTQGSDVPSMNPDKQKINVKVSAGSCNVNFLG